MRLYYRVTNFVIKFSKLLCIVLLIESYFGNGMMKLIINNKTNAWKTDIDWQMNTWKEVIVLFLNTTNEINYFWQTIIDQ